MKYCITANGDNLDAALDLRFGRAIYFLIVDDEGELIKAIKNTGAEAMRGAGVAAAQIIAEEKVDIIITGNIGPNAFTVLRGSGAKIFIGSSGASVQDVFQKYQKGEFKEMTEVVPCGPGYGAGLGLGQRWRNFRGGGRGRK